MRSIDTNQARELQARGAPFIDVLPPEHFATRHIAGSDNVPLGSHDFPDKVEQLTGNRERTVVVYCAGPSCDASAIAARRLEEAGFRDVADFEGGIEAWDAADLPLATSWSRTG